MENHTLDDIAPDKKGEFDYTYVHTPGRVACYDSLMSAPRITEISPAPTNEYIEKLTTTIYEQSHMAGGKIPYTSIREVSENFIHAQFSEIVVSILDDGNTIRFADQGPGIAQKDRAQLPGFSSAIEPMKKYIRGVGSGLPLVREFLNSAQGTITIEDNLNSGAVVTISLVQKAEEQKKEPVQAHKILIPNLTERERTILGHLAEQNELGITDIKTLTGLSPSSVSNEFKKLEEMNLVEMGSGKKRKLTDYGKKVVDSL